MRVPKKYGQSKTEQCPFCDKRALLKNKQDVPVCDDHKNALLPPLTCMCGAELELRSSKFGSYFNCMSCGNISFKKALSINGSITPMQPTPTKKDTPSFKKNTHQPTEVTISSEDLDTYYG